MKEANVIMTTKGLVEEKDMGSDVGTAAVNIMAVAVTDTEDFVGGLLRWRQTWI